MPKKKSDGDSLQDLFALAISSNTREDTKGKTGGVEFRTLAERWIMDSNIIRSGEMYMLVGDPASGKSLFMQHMAAMFVRAGGGAQIIDTEHKSNSESSIIPNVGEDVYYSGRFGLTTAGSIDIQNKIKAGKQVSQADRDDAIDDCVRSWQGMLEDRIRTIRESKLRDIPMFLGVDSLVGAPSSESKRKFGESGGNVEGRSSTHLARAKSISEFFQNILGELQGTKITLAFTNHTKTKINMTNMPTYGGPQITMPGGDEPKFRSSMVLKFGRAGKSVKKAEVTGVPVRLSVIKNSFGDDSRKLDVVFYFSIDRDKEGNVILNDAGQPRRRISWDWDEASASLIKRFCVGGATRDESTAAARRAFPGLKITGRGVTSEELGISNMSLPEFGRLLIQNEDLYRRMMEIHALNINHAARDIIVPDWSGTQYDFSESGLSVDDGEWEKADDLEEEEEDA